MRNKPIFYIGFFVFFLYSCAAQKGTIELGTLKGVVGIFEGNCMPSPGVEPCKAQPITATVFVTSVSEKFSMEQLEDSVVTNNKGEFTLRLPTGSYSLFVKDGNEVICGGMNCDKVCYCTPFKIQADSTTIVNSNIDHASW